MEISYFSVRMEGVVIDTATKLGDERISSAICIVSARSSSIFTRFVSLFVSSSIQTLALAAFLWAWSTLCISSRFLLPRIWAPKRFLANFRQRLSLDTWKRKQRVCQPWLIDALWGKTRSFWERASVWAKRTSEASSAEQVNEGVMRAKEWTDVRVAQYSNLCSWLFWTTDWEATRES